MVLFKANARILDETVRIGMEGEKEALNLFANLLVHRPLLDSQRNLTNLALHSRTPLPARPETAPHGSGGDLGQFGRW
jgi:hypothetical protein